MRRAGTSLDSSGLHLEPIPLLVGEGDRGKGRQAERGGLRHSMPGNSNFSAFSALRRFAREESEKRETAEA